MNFRSSDFQNSLVSGGNPINFCFLLDIISNLDSNPENSNINIISSQLDDIYSILSNEKVISDDFVENSEIISALISIRRSFSDVEISSKVFKTILLIIQYSQIGTPLLISYDPAPLIIQSFDSLPLEILELLNQMLSFSRGVEYCKSTNLISFMFHQSHIIFINSDIKTTQDYLIFIMLVSQFLDESELNQYIQIIIDIIIKIWNSFNCGAFLSCIFKILCNLSSLENRSVVFSKSELSFIFNIDLELISDKYLNIYLNILSKLLIDDNKDFISYLLDQINIYYFMENIEKFLEFQLFPFFLNNVISCSRDMIDVILEEKYFRVLCESLETANSDITFSIIWIIWNILSQCTSRQMEIILNSPAFDFLIDSFDSDDENFVKNVLIPSCEHCLEHCSMILSNHERLSILEKSYEEIKN